jgi:hypothetical protein
MPRVSGLPDPGFGHKQKCLQKRQGILISCFSGQPDDKENILMYQQKAQENTGINNSYKEKGTEIDPYTFLTTWNFNNLEGAERDAYYKETPLENGSLSI